MIKRLYVHNFRCFENFEFKIGLTSSLLLIGKNGVGKSTVAAALRIFQSIGRGVNRIGKLVNANDFSCARTDVPMRFQLDVLLNDKLYEYHLALELPDNFKELRVLEESLTVAGKSVYSRSQATVTLPSMQSGSDSQFLVDWHLVALPVIQARAVTDPMSIFKSWLGKMVVLAPIPQNITGESFEETLNPSYDGSNLGDWLSGLLSQYPSAYTTIHKHLSAIMPDLAELQNEPVGRDAKRMIVHFSANSARFTLGFNSLSDGEKCYFLCAVIIAANKAYGPLFCFWDEPDNFLSLSEVGNFIMVLRKSFLNRGQIMVTSHNEEAIRKFSTDNTWVMDRRNHLEPSLIRLLAELPNRNDLIQDLVSGELML